VTKLMAKTVMMAAVAGVPCGTRASQGGAADIAWFPRTPRPGADPANLTAAAWNIQTSLSEWGTIYGEGAPIHGAAGATVGCGREGPRANSESHAYGGFDATKGPDTFSCGHNGTVVYQLANPTLGSGLHSKITPLLLRRLSRASRLRQ
jgi:hypothetical protein